MSASGKHGAVWSYALEKWVNSPAFNNRLAKSQAASKRARKARRRNRA